MTLYSIVLWHGLTLVRYPAETTWRTATIDPILKIRRWGIIAIHFVGLTIAAGSIVAGIDAGKVFNTWPLMNGA
jgi:heme A synthase